MNWENSKTQKGISAMMDLVGESADQIEEFLEMRLGGPLEEHVRDRVEFKGLQKFYSRHFRTRFKDGVEGEEEWDEEDEAEAVLLDLSKTGLKDFETVKKDLEYELF